MHAHKIVQVEQFTVPKGPLANLQRRKPGKANCNLVVLTAAPHFQFQLELGSAPWQDPENKIW